VTVSYNTGLRERDINRDAESLYMSEIEIVPLLTADQEIELGRLVKQGDSAARQKMIESNLRLVVKIARRYRVPKMSLMDIVEEGNIGLMQAVEKFDPEKGFRFSTYASWWIRHQIERAVMNQSRTVRLPVHVVRELNRYKRAAYELVSTLQHEPNNQEIAESTDSSAAQVDKLFAYNLSTASVDAPLGNSESGDFTLLDAVADTASVDPIAEAQQHDIYAHISEWLDFLGDKQREIVERRFGLSGYDPQTLEKVAGEVGLTRERVRQIQIQSLDKLKQILTRNGFSWDSVSQIS